MPKMLDNWTRQNISGVAVMLPVVGEEDPEETVYDTMVDVKGDMDDCQTKISNNDNIRREETRVSSR